MTSPRAMNVRKLNRATAVAISLSAVAFLGVGSGLAVATAVNAKDSTSTNPLTSRNGGSTQQLPQHRDDLEGDAGDSGGYWEMAPPNSDSAPDGGFAQAPSGGSHGNSGMS